MEATLVRLVKSSEFKDIEKRKGKSRTTGRAWRASRSLDAYELLKTSLTAFARAADADLAALLQRELLACVDLYGELKSGAARSISGPAAEGTRSRARLRPRPARVPGAIQIHPRRRVPGYRSAAGGDTLCSWRDKAPESGARSPEPDWRSVCRSRRGALFVVGDPKQSIYRFRRADVGIYQEVCDLLVDRHGARRVHLRTNFRTVPTIQHAVNAAFAPAMRRDHVSLQADYVALAPHREELRLHDGRPSSADAQTAGSRLAGCRLRAASGARPGG